MLIAPLAYLVFAASPAATSPASAQDFASAQDPLSAQVPVTGVWKGLAQSDGPMVPTGGMPVSLWLRRTEAGAQGQFLVQGFVSEVLEAVELTLAERLIIDLRNNSGGNSSVLSNQMERLASHPRLAQPGSIIALIGPVTYSSGMMNAHQLRENAHATLVGEPTGGKPNSYGEVRTFRLPNSGLSVSYSTKYFRMLEEDPPSVEPDVLVELESGAHFGGQDPVLRRALKLEVGSAGK